jgi:hypothetical protein
MWSKAVALRRMGEGKVETASPISGNFALADRREAFDVFAARGGLGTLIDDAG